MPAEQLKPCPREPVAKSTKLSRYIKTKTEYLTFGRTFTFWNSMVHNEHIYGNSSRLSGTHQIQASIGQ